MPWLWRQSNHLVGGEKVWDAARAIDPAFTGANMFWWYDMYSSVDYSATPRPMYPADGRKLPAIYTQPAELRDELQKQLGQFPLFSFWGPNAGIVSSRWIVRSAIHTYDPVEMFIDPELSFLRVSVAWRLAKKLLGFRSLMNVIPSTRRWWAGATAGSQTDTNRGPCSRRRSPTRCRRARCRPPT